MPAPPDVSEGRYLVHARAIGADEDEWTSIGAMGDYDRAAAFADWFAAEHEGGRVVDRASHTVIYQPAKEAARQACARRTGPRADHRMEAAHDQQ